MPSTYTILLYHVVFSTKNRRERITPEIQSAIYPYIGGIVRNLDATMLAIGGMPDHVHLLVQLPPRVGLADFIGKVKANSSKHLNEDRDHPMAKKFAWQKGYGAFSVSVSMLEIVQAYIENQADHHRTQTFQEEFIVLLKRHGIEYDEERLWT